MTTTAPPYTMTYDTITVVWGGKTHTVRRGTPNFVLLQNALVQEKWEEVENHLTIAVSLEAWAKGKFTVKGETVLYEGDPLPHSLNQRILDMAAKGESPQPLFLFWERLQKNPSFRSVQQLWNFLSHRNIPLTEDGCFLAYKSVKMDYKDHHTGRFDNSPGKVLSMPRNKISDDPNVACHVGFHVGAVNYARTFRGDSRLVICKVDPQDVVCVPYDSSHEKMRVCKYEVIGNYGADLPSTTYSEPSEDWEDEYTEEEIEEEFEEELEEKEANQLEATFPKMRVVKDLTDEDMPQEKEVKVGAHPQKPLSEMSFAELMQQHMSDLRKYASSVLKIVGAYKIQGGKGVLVSRIVEVRDTGNSSKS